MPRNSKNRPRRREIGSFVFKRVWAAGPPRVQISLGRIAYSCLSRNGSQAAISSVSGFRLAGGRHLMMLQM